MAGERGGEALRRGGKCALMWRRQRGSLDLVGVEELKAEGASESEEERHAGERREGASMGRRRRRSLDPVGAVELEVGGGRARGHDLPQWRSSRVVARWWMGSERPEQAEASGWRGRGGQAGREITARGGRRAAELDWGREMWVEK
ncbi:hypothetical protein BS78_02G345600 [Paspalum vaginatum]|nr:hypothetical protein BS78_02G345600 [Paspalum vaginatum]